METCMRLQAPVAVMLLASVLAFAGCKGDEAEGRGPGGPGGGPPGEMQIPVEAAILKARPMTATIIATGTLRADESVTLRPEVAGRITRIGFDEGKRVDQGQVLFVLDPAIANAELREAQAMAEVSSTALRRADSMGARSLISKAEIDRLRGDAAVMSARAASARTRLAKTRIVAPFSGHAGLRDVSIGEFVTAGQALVTLVRLDPIEVDFSLPETQLAQVAVGQNILIGFDAFRERRFTGEVVAVDPVINPTSRSARVRARIANPDGLLRPGLSARLALDVGEERTALMLPEQALLQEGDVRFVYAIKGGKAKKTVVQTGRRLPGEIEIVSGLSAGDQVITAGQAKPMMHEGVAVVAIPGSDEADAAKAKPEPTGAKPAAANSRPGPAATPPAEAAPAAAE